MDIFLIYDNPTDYDSDRTVIGFKTIESDADRIVENLSNEYKEMYGLYKQILDAMQKYRLANPLPEQEKPLERIKWPAGIAQKDITHAMRDERKHIEDKNEMIYHRNSKKLLDYNIAMTEALKPLLATKDQEWVKKNFNIG